MPPTADAETLRHRGLVRAKTFATLLLVAMAVVFVIAWILQDSHPAFGYVRAAAEAGMVGGLADWFAVTALFRHPLGLPIPHTAIIPRRKAMLGSALSDFVATNFLSSDVVRGRLSRVDIAGAVGGWLATPDHAAAVTAELGSAVRGISTILADDEIAAGATSFIRDRIARTHVGPPVGRIAAGVFERGEHRPVVDLVIDRCCAWIADNHDTVARVVSRQAPAWSPHFVDSLVADRVYREVVAFAHAVRDDRSHPLRKAVDMLLTTFAEDLQHDPTTMVRADRFAARVMANEQVKRLVADSWVAIRREVTESAADPDSPLRQAVCRGVRSFGARIAGDRALADKINAWILDAAAWVADHHARTITGIIDDTIARWDGPRTSRTIELHVGRDLQFIRVNGTVVGAAAGLAIYAIAQWLLGS